MIKVQYPIDGSFIIDSGKLITDNQGLQQVFNSMYQEVLPSEGEPDFVLAKRLIKLIGTGKVIVKIAEQSDPEIVY